MKRCGMCGEQYTQADVCAHYCNACKAKIGMVLTFKEREKLRLSPGQRLDTYLEARKRWGELQGNIAKSKAETIATMDRIRNAV